MKRRQAFLLLGVLTASQIAAGETPIRDGGPVTRLEVSLDAEHHNAHVAWIPSRERQFELRITPTFDAWNDVESWVVEFFSGAETSRYRHNLLAPPGNWHGLQAFDVLPRDVEGAAVYPARRVIDRAEFTCTIEVLGGSAKPSHSIQGARVFDSLTLGIEIMVKTDEASSTRDEAPRQP